MFLLAINVQHLLSKIFDFVYIFKYYNVPSILMGETGFFLFFVKVFIDKCTLQTNGDISLNEWYPVVKALNFSTYLFIMIF